jgi:hypothetical protein
MPVFGVIAGDKIIEVFTLQRIRLDRRLYARFFYAHASKETARKARKAEAEDSKRHPTPSVSRLVNRLKHCDDIAPSIVCNGLDMEAGSTWAQVAKEVTNLLKAKRL